jgi:hypothetical protein
MLTNTELLADTGSPYLLTTIDRQRRYLLRMLIQAKRCPNCSALVNYFAALRIAIDDLDLMKPGDDHGECPRCHRGLIKVLPLSGSWHWTLAPIAPPSQGGR